MALMLLMGALHADTPARSALYYFREAERQLAHEEYREALANYRYCLERNEHFPAAHIGAASAYYELGEWQRARDHYERALELDRNNVPARTGLALVYIEIGGFPRARELLLAVQQTDPGNADNNYALGVYHRRTGSASLAESYFEKAIRLQASHVRALVGLARIMADTGRLERARRIGPLQVEIHSSAGEIALKQAFAAPDAEVRETYLARARESFVTAARLQPDNRQVAGRLVLIDLYTNEAGSARERVETLLEAEPRNPHLHYMLGVLERRSGNQRAALTEIQRALQLDPADSFVRFSLEDLAQDLRDSGMALRRGLAAYHYERVQHNREQRRPDRLQSHLRRTLLLDPFHEAARRDELDQARRDGDYEGFIHSLQRLRERHADDAGIAYRLERALESRRSNLAYRANLLSPIASPARATFERSPVRVFVFDFRSTDPFPGHADGPELIAAAINFELSAADHIDPVPDELRRLVLGRIRQDSRAVDRFPFGVAYRPEFIARVEEFEERERPVAYVLAGSYRQVNEALHVDCELIEKGAGIRVARFSIEGRGRDAIHDVALAVARRLREELPFEGRVVRVAEGQVYLNVGRVDGLRVDQELLVYRLGSLRGKLKVREVATYVARAEPTGASADRFDTGDRVVAGN